MKKTTTLLTMLAVTHLVLAQGLNTHYLYQLNWFNINPAYTGESKGLKAILNSSTQWVGIEGNPTNSMFGLQAGIGESAGLGGKIIVDRRGVFTNLTAEINYSYKIKLTENHLLSMGVTAGVFQSNLSRSSLLGDRFTDLDDPALQSSFFNQTQLISSFGFLYQFKELEVGVSAPHFVVSGSPISDHLFVTARHNFYNSENLLRITPLLVFQQLSNSPNLLDIGAQFEWNQLIWTQLTYRTNNTIGLAGGLHIKKFMLGYLYNASTSQINFVSPGSHEIYLAINFGKRKTKSSTQQAEKNGKRTVPNNDLKSRSINKQAENFQNITVEIKQIQQELSELIDKVKKGTQTPTDEKRIAELEKRIKNLKQKHSK